MKPLTPAEVKEKWYGAIDPFIIQSFNELLIENFSPLKSEMVIKQKEVINRYMKLAGISAGTEWETKRSQLYKSNQFDIEDLYRSEGWQVVYKPGWDESYDASFKFKVKK